MQGSSLSRADARRPFHRQAMEQRAIFEHASSGCAPKLRALLSKGTSTEHKDPLGCTPLLVASRNGHLDCVSALLAANADFDETDATGLTALHFAAAFGHLDVVRVLLTAGADPEAEDEARCAAKVQATSLHSFPHREVGGDCCGNCRWSVMQFTVLHCTESQTCDY